MTEDILARRLFKEQIRKELLDELRKCIVGFVGDGEITATKNSNSWNGYLLIIPDEKYYELFGDEK